MYSQRMTAQSVSFPALQQKPSAVQEDMLEERIDLGGLIQFLDRLERAGVQVSRVVHCVNDWTIGGVIPLQHHGLVLTLEDQGYLALDFGRNGISWMVCQVCPGFPEGTCWVRSYDVQVDPYVIRDYCAETTPFQWMSNDCKTWSRGMIEEMGISELEGMDLLDTQLGGQSIEKRCGYVGSRGILYPPAQCA